jgi:hypothetical protein
VRVQVVDALDELVGLFGLECAYGKLDSAIIFNA